MPTSTTLTHNPLRSLLRASLSITPFGALSRQKSFTCAWASIMAGSNPFVTEAFALLGVALAMIILRTVARATSVGIRNFQLDDYMMLLAAVSFAYPQ